jgi:hypothetical protein
MKPKRGDAISVLALAPLASSVVAMREIKVAVRLAKLQLLPRAL